jgi:glycine C-acetyltransferase
MTTFSRYERFVPKSDTQLEVTIEFEGQGPLKASLIDISKTGLGSLIGESNEIPAKGTIVKTISIQVAEQSFPLGSGKVSRSDRVYLDHSPSNLHTLAVAFDESQDKMLGELHDYLQYYPYVTDELQEDKLNNMTSDLEAKDYSLKDFYETNSSDLFDKCNRFYEYVKDFQQKRFFQALYRVTLTSGLDNRITVFNPISRREEEMVCFDSNSYLGLHKHPRVAKAVEQTLKQTGYGTPSAQLLCGTNRYLRELEETISHYHRREATILFSSGYAANVGALTALVRKNDLVVRDRLSHASIHDGCKFSQTRFMGIYPHDDMEALEKILAEAEDNNECQGKMIVTDGVFSMHGRITSLPKLVELKKRYNAKLMMDEAHATGIIGPNGHGTEDKYDLFGSADIIMGTLSKAPGTVGGYICGSQDLIYYLRFFANSAMFTAALPAPTCAGAIEAYKIMEEEPEHRQRLWENVHKLSSGLKDLGYIVNEPDSAILTVFMGYSNLMWIFSHNLFTNGIKCGNVVFPAVPKGEAILRLTLNARHTQRDIDRVLGVFEKLGDQYNLLGRSREELLEIGSRLNF